MSAKVIDQFEAGIQELRIEFEKFFNGASAMPPVELRDRLQRQLKRLRDQPTLGYAERFRLTQMEARFNSYSELFHRRLRDHEEGRRQSVATPQAAPAINLADGIVLRDTSRPEAVEALYVGLLRGHQKTRLDLESFRVYLDRQLAEIRKQTGCEQVRFRLVDEDGQLKLKARPVRESTASS